MGFLEEMKRLLDIDEKAQQTTFVHATSGGIVIEGYKKIRELSSVKIQLLCEDCKLLIVGDNLKINELSHGELSVKGQIRELKFER